MSTNQENRLRSFEEALRGRPEEIGESLPPEVMDEPDPTTEELAQPILNQLALEEEMDGTMTEEEVLEQALGEEKAEMLLGTNSQEIPETPMNRPEAPASTIAPPPVDMPSTQAYPPQSQEEKNSPKKRFEGFVRGPEFTISWVEQHLQQFSNVPYILPSPSAWVGLDGLDVPKAVHDLMRSPSFLNRIWRQLEMVMGLSVDNTPWCVEVACSMMLFHFLWYLSE